MRENRTLRLSGGRRPAFGRLLRPDSKEVPETGWSEGAVLQSCFDQKRETPLESKTLHYGMDGRRVSTGTRDAGEGLAFAMETEL